MGIRTKFNPMGGSNGKFYTLTIVTNPAAATCTLTINGIQYVTKSKKVKEGTIVNYSVYHSTYGTKTGNITVDSDITLTFTGATQYGVRNSELTTVGTLNVGNATNNISYPYTCDSTCAASGFSASNYIRTTKTSKVFCNNSSYTTGVEGTITFKSYNKAANQAVVYHPNTLTIGYSSNGDLIISIGNAINKTVDTSKIVSEHWLRVGFGYAYLPDMGGAQYSLKVTDLSNSVVLLSQTGSSGGSFLYLDNQYIYFGISSSGSTPLNGEIAFDMTNFVFYDGGELTSSYKGTIGYAWDVTQS